MLLIRTSAGESRLINLDHVLEIRAKQGGVGSEITLRDKSVVVTDTSFGEFARDLFTKKFVGRV